MGGVSSLSPPNGRAGPAAAHRAPAGPPGTRPRQTPQIHRTPPFLTPTDAQSRRGHRRGGPRDRTRHRAPDGRGVFLPLRRFKRMIFRSRCAYGRVASATAGARRVAAQVTPMDGCSRDRLSQAPRRSSSRQFSRVMRARRPDLRSWVTEAFRSRCASFATSPVSADTLRRPSNFCDLSVSARRTEALGCLR